MAENLNQVSILNLKYTHIASIYLPINTFLK